MKSRHRPSWAFWVFLPIVALLLFSLAVSAEFTPHFGRWVTLGCALAGVLLVLGLYDSRRFSWALRALAFMVFAAYLIYFVDQLRSGASFRPGPTSRPSGLNALLGLIVFGIPGLLFAIRARPEFPPLALPPDDPLLLAAVRHARATLPEFRKLLAAGQGLASVKCPLVTSSGTVEHVWAEVLEHVANQVTVRLVTPPVTHTGALERVYTKSLDDLDDWQVTLPSGEIRGGFTMRVMFKRGREQWGSLPPELEELESKYGAA